MTRLASRTGLARITSLALLANLLLTAAPGLAGSVGADGGACGRRYVASGDHYPAGHEIDEAQRYPNHLQTDHLQAVGFCLFNIAKNDTTSQAFVSGSGAQLAQTWNLQPDLITVTLGEENGTIVNLVTSCFDKLKDHDFTGSATCAGQIYGNSSLFSSLTTNLTTMLQADRMIMAGRPQLVIAVTGYPNPYPKASDAIAKMTELCVPLIDTIPTCFTRWAQLPIALTLLDQVFLKLNTTIQNAVKPFQTGPSGNRFVFVDTYTKMRDHCMKMEVTIKTQVEHPEEDGVVHEHDSPAVNFGCDPAWFKAGDDGTKTPDYLDPAAIGVLIQKSQTTSGMGVHPNDDGNKCISDLIWDADTIDPGTTPLKWKLNVAEASKTDICQ